MIDCIYTLLQYSHVYYMSAVVTVRGARGSRSCFPIQGHSHPSGSIYLELIHSKAAQNSTRCFADPEQGGIGSSPCHGTDGNYGHAPLCSGETLVEGWSLRKISALALQGATRWPQALHVAGNCS